MCTRVAIRLVLSGLTALFISASQAMGQVSSPHTIFDDALNDGSRGSYETMGDVTWTNQSVRLRKRAAIARPLVTSPRSTLRANLLSPSAPARTDLQFTFGVGDEAASVFLRTEPATRGGTRILVVGKHYGQREVVRDALINRPLAGTWSIEFNHGVFDIAVDGVSLLMAYVETGYRSPSTLTVGVTSGEVSLTRLTLSAVGKVAPANASAVAVEGRSTELYLHGRFKEALVEVRKELEAARTIYGEDSIQVAGLTNNLGSYLHHLGAPREARGHLERALALSESILGELHPDTAACLSGLASLLVTQRDYAQAAAYYRRILKIAGTVLGEDDPRTIKANGYMGNVLNDLGAYEESLAFLDKQVRGQETLWGHDNQHIGGALIQRSSVLETLGRPDEALDDASRALAIYERDLNDDNIEIARAANTVGHLLIGRGRYEKGLTYLHQALRQCERVLGPSHRYTAITRSNIGYALARLGRYKEAYTTLGAVLETETTLAADILPVLSDAEAIAYVRMTRSYRDGLLDVAFALEQVSARELYGFVLRTKGLVQNLMARSSAAVPATGRGHHLNGELMRVRAQLAALVYQAPDGAAGGVSARELGELVQEKERIQRELRQIGAESPDDARQSVEDIISAIDSDTAVVDLTEAYVSVADVPQGKRHREYVAFVLNRDGGGNGSVTSVRLGDAATIDSAVTRWRRLLRDLSADESATRDAGLAVRRATWDKFSSALAGKTNVLVIPDGTLTGVPWMALPDDTPSAYLIDRLAVSVAPVVSPPRTRGSVPGAEKLLLVGDVDFGEVSGGTGRTPLSEAQEALFRGGTNWMPLPRTADELKEIGRLAGRRLTSVLSKAKATETGVRAEIRGARFVHFATHGFFADPVFRSALRLDAPQQRVSFGGFAAIGAGGTISNRNPLLLSALVLAGANNRVDAKPTEDGALLDDGLLTGEEVAGLVLDKTDVVVLSACETGVGEVAGGEGIFGLQRAFQLAGARSVIGSLWNVSDNASTVLMTELYTNLWAKNMNVRDALRFAQLTMLNRFDVDTGRLREESDKDPAQNSSSGRKRAAPLYWAAFVLSGDVN